MKKRLFLLVTLLFSAVLTFSQEKDFASPTGIEMVYVKGGTFQMGSEDGDSDQRPVHSVTVSSFYIGKYEVTQKEYQAVMGTNPSHFKGDNLPVEMVSWYDAIEYCNKLSIKEALTPVYTIDKSRQDPNNKNRSDDVKWTVSVNWSADGYRLPTEAEWEYAARGGDKSGGFKYSGSSNIGDVAWYSDNSDSKSHPVGRKNANELGIYDMSGNVWEWCWDWHGSYTGGSKTNPKGASNGTIRVTRGGNWLFFARQCTVSYRSPFDASIRLGNVGFRVSRRIP